MFISQKEWKEHHGGAYGSVASEASQKESLKRQRVPIDACGLSLAPCVHPVATRVGHPILYDLKNIVRHVKQHRSDPICGRPLSGKDLVRVKFLRGADGHYLCPATRKPIGPHSHAKIIMTTGRVYLADALEALCFTPRAFQDPIDSTDFDPSRDVLTLNNPADPAWRDIQRWAAELGGSSPVKSDAAAGGGGGGTGRSGAVPPSPYPSAGSSPTTAASSSSSASSASSSRGAAPSAGGPGSSLRLDQSSMRILEQVRERAAKRARSADGSDEATKGAEADEADDPFSAKGGLGSFAPAPKRLRISAPSAAFSGPDGYGGGGDGTGDPEAERERALRLLDAYHVPGDYRRPAAGEGGASSLVSRAAGFTSTAMGAEGETQPRCASVRKVVSDRLLRVQATGKRAFVRVTVGVSSWVRPEPRTAEYLVKASEVASYETLGQLSLELYVDAAPLTCHNFLQLVRRGYYTGVAFHRLIRNFMVQGGDPTATGKSGYSWDGGKFIDECRQRGSKAGSLKHTERGLLSMANAGPDTNGSQFFVLFQPAPHLDGKHTVFGKVVGGQSTLRAIEILPVGEGNRPKRRVCMCKWEVFGDPFEDDAKDRRAEFEALEKRAVSAPAARVGASVPSKGSGGGASAGAGGSLGSVGGKGKGGTGRPDPFTAVATTAGSSLSKPRKPASVKGSSTASGLLDSGLDVDW